MFASRAAARSLPLRATLVAVALALPGLAEDPAPRDLDAELRQAAQSAYEARARESSRQGGSRDEVVAWSIRLLRSEVGKGIPNPERLAAVKRHHDRVLEQEGLLAKSAQFGAASGADLECMKYHLLQAERWVAQAQAGSFTLD